MNRQELEQYARDAGVATEGLDLVLRRHAFRTKIAMSGGGSGAQIGNEQSLGAVVGFPNVDLIVSPEADAQLIGARLRLYAISPVARTLEAEATIRRVDRPARLSAFGRSCTRWEAAIVMATGATQTTAPRAITLLSNSDAGTPYDRRPSPGLVPTTDPTLDFSVGQDSRAIPNTAGAKLQGAWGYNRNAAARFLQFFDAAALPANGTTPLLSVEVAAGAPFNVVLTDPADPPPSGLGVALGITWALSSTENVLTAVGGPFTVHTRYVL